MQCIYHHVCITRKVVIKLRNVYIITCASLGKLVEGCGVYISSRVHDKESCNKVAEYIIILLRLHYKQSCYQVVECIYHVQDKESCYKVVEFIYHHMCITRKVGQQF